MDNNELKLEIDKWANWLPNSDEQLIELAFFKIFIKFEKFLSDVFIHYSIGEYSIHNYRPDRKLSFENKTQLDSIIGNKRNDFVNHYDLVFKLSEHIFDTESSLVRILESTTVDEINKMKKLRDYIAHESESSKSKYENSLNNGRFIEPYEYLNKRKNKNSAKTNYTYYVELMINISDFILKEPN